MDNILTFVVAALNLNFPLPDATTMEKSERKRHVNKCTFSVLPTLSLSFSSVSTSITLSSLILYGRLNSWTSLLLLFKREREREQQRVRRRRLKPA